MPGITNTLINSVRYVAYSCALALCKRPHITILPDEETARLIREEGYSLTRFGDGEFQWMTGKNKVSGFQQSSEQLSIALREAYRTKLDKLLVGVPRALVNDKGYTLQAKAFWRGFVSRNQDLLQALFDGTRTKYANASITRPYIDYSSKEDATHRFELVKSLWASRDLLIIEGSSTGFGVGNDLLDNAASIKRLECPPVNAFAHYREILTTALKYAHSATLVLLCLGPTASVLAYELAKEGLQAVDIGHLDLEYEWFLRGSNAKDSVPGKHVNENKDSRIERTAVPEHEIIAIIG